MSNNKLLSVVGTVVCSITFLNFNPAAAQTVKSVTRISVSSSGTQSDDDSDRPAVSNGGLFVAFQSNASNLISGDTDRARDIFVRDTDGGLTTRISGTTQVEGDGDSGTSNASERALSISSDGRYIAYMTDATNVFSGDTNGATDVVLYDQDKQTTTRANIHDNSSITTGNALSPTISDDGSFLAFESRSDFISTDLNSAFDVYVRDLVDSTTKLVSAAASLQPGDNISQYNAISGDGNYIAFASVATDLISSDTNAKSDIFLANRSSGNIARVSVTSSGSQSNGDSSLPAISSDGQFVVFESDATNIVSNATSGFKQIYLYDSSNGSVELVSIGSDANAANSDCTSAVVSGDGRFVAFSTHATNMVTGDTNGVDDIFLRDRVMSKTIRVSVTSSGAQTVLSSFHPAISQDGRFVAFDSADSTIVSGDTNSKTDVFLVEIKEAISPGTEIVTAPDVGVSGNSVTITMQDFGGTTISRSRSARLAARKKRAKVTVNYVVQVNGRNSNANIIKRKVTKRNQVTIRNLAAGSYTARYQVEVRRGTRVLFSTNTSPLADFNI